MKSFRLITAALCAVVLLATSTSKAFAEAGQAHINVGPNTSVNAGTNFTVTLTEDSGSTPINLVTAVLSYDQAQVQFIGFDDSASAFDFKGASSGANGSISVKRGLYGGAYTGSHIVVGVTFKALGNSNVTSIALASGTAVTNPETGANVWDQSISAASITLNAPAAQPQTGGQGGGTPTHTSTTPAAQQSGARANTGTASTPSTPDATETTGAVQSAETKGDATKTNSGAKKEAAHKASSKLPYWILAIIALIVAAGFVARRRLLALLPAAPTKKPVTKSATSIKTAPKKQSGKRTTAKGKGKK